MAYASTTTVPVEKTRAEIEQLLVKHRATHFMSAWGEEDGKRRAVIAFEMHDRRLMFHLPLPDPNERAFTHAKMRGYAKRRTDAAAARAWEQACRSRWRGLLLTIKAKLESVEAGIETFEEAFLAQVVVSDGTRQTTMGKWAAPRIAAAYSGTPLPRLLPGAKDDAGDIVDAEEQRRG
jgi:hypothetical protein